MSKNISKNTNCRKTRSSLTKVLFTVSLVATVGISIFAFKGHKALTEVPAMPKLDLDKWWGENSTKVQQDASVRKFRILFTDAVLFTVSLVATVGISIFAFKGHKALTEVPAMPKLDLDKWWGENSTKVQQDASVRKFRILFTDAMQEELVKKFELHRRRIPAPNLEGSAWNYGVNSKSLKEVFDFWQYKYVMRDRQRFLNKFDHFKTNLQGLDVHFVHVKPKVKDSVEVLPILLLHGWPGSIREFYELIPLLTTPRSDCNFVFEVIAPSLPGFGYSQAPTKPGMNTVQMAILMRNLMNRLGFTKFYLQGGDFGHAIGSHMATIFPNEVLGFHSNFLANFSLQTMFEWTFGAVWPSLVVKKEYENRLYPLKDRFDFYLLESGYMHLQGTKPDTVGVALNDSPMGLASYILDRFMIFTDPSNKDLSDGGISQIDLTGFLDNVMIYWATGSIVSSMRLYKETFGDVELEQVFSRIPTSVPVWGLKARHELVYQPDWFLSTKYPNLLGSTHLQDGGHFIAFEKPGAVADDVFLAVRRFKEFRNRNGELEN